MDIPTFKKIVWGYYKKNKRDLPWRRNINPYRVVVSEVMLQQTQVNRVKERFHLFLKLFPNFKALSAAPTSEVVKAWSGLGYYRRALNVKRLADIVTRQYKGKLPQTIPELIKLPGIGKNTAGAIVAYAFNKPSVFIETNIRKIYIHHFFPNSKRVDDERLLKIVESSLPKGKAREWYQALMDYGTYLAATVENPNRRSKHYTRQSAFVGSNRQKRSILLKKVMAQHKTTRAELRAFLPGKSKEVDRLLEQLEREGFISIRGNYVFLA